MTRAVRSKARGGAAARAREDSLGLARLTDIHDQGRGPRKDVRHGDDGKTQARPRRSFTKEFKAEVVELVRQDGNAAACVDRDLT